MGVVHGLQGDTGVIAVKVAVLDQILYGVDNLCIVKTEGLGLHEETVVRYVVEEKEKRS